MKTSIKGESRPEKNLRLSHEWRVRNNVRVRKLVRLRMEWGSEYTEIAEYLGISKQAVEQLRDRIIVEYGTGTFLPYFEGYWGINRSTLALQISKENFRIAAEATGVKPTLIRSQFLGYTFGELVLISRTDADLRREWCPKCSKPFLRRRDDQRYCRKCERLVFLGRKVR